jgi:predicted signal transduction protein with EAL and GGDEF domain
VIPWTLRAAAGLVSLEALVEAVAVSGRASLTVGLRVLLVISLAMKWLFAWRVVRLSPGAALGLLLLEGTTVVAAFGAVDSGAGARLALGGTALAVMVLLSASLHAFPTPALPKG